MSSNFIMMTALAEAFNPYPGLQPTAYQVVTLFHFDGAVGAKSSGGNYAEKGSVSSGGGNYSGEVVRFGPTSGAMARSRWWNASIPTARNLNDADFTVEINFYIPSTVASTERHAIFGSNGGAQGFNLYVPADRSLRLFGAVGTTYYGNFASAPGIVTNDEWHHVAITRKDGYFTIWFNGKAVASAPAWNPTTGTLLLGRYTDSNNTVIYNYGFLDEYRYCHGVAVYTEEFVPPTIPFVL